MQRKQTWQAAMMVTVALAAGACSSAQRTDDAAAGADGTYVDPWGTTVAWNPVPAPSGGVVPATTPAAPEADEPKPKVEEETTTVTVKEEEATISSGLPDDDDE